MARNVNLIVSGDCIQPDLRSYHVTCRVDHRSRKVPNRQIVIGSQGLITADQKAC